MGFRQWLPWLSTGKAEVNATTDPCGMNGPAARFAAMWLAMLEERGRTLRCDGRLVAVAQQHAEYLNGRDGEELEQSMHFGRGGSTPNQRVRGGGYRLLDWHGGGNTVECCVRCSADPVQALDVLLASPRHRPVLLGKGFWGPSINFGVGQDGADWVILVCPPE